MNSLIGPDLAQLPCIPSRTAQFGQVLKTMEERVVVLLKDTSVTKTYKSRRLKLK